MLLPQGWVPDSVDCEPVPWRCLSVQILEPVLRQKHLFLSVLFLTTRRKMAKGFSKLENSKTFQKLLMMAWDSSLMSIKLSALKILFKVMGIMLWALLSACHRFWRESIESKRTCFLLLKSFHILPSSFYTRMIL